MLLTMGLRGTNSLCIFGSPYSLGGLQPAGRSCLHVSSVRVDFLSSSVVFRSVESVGSVASLLQGGAKRTHVFEMGSSRENFFLWGYLKSKVYVRKPRTVDDLKVSIREEIATVPQEMLVNVMQNFKVRLRTCVRQEGWTPSFRCNFP